MKRFLRTMVIILLIVMLVSSMVACKDKDAPATETAKETKEATKTETPKKEEKEPEEMTIDEIGVVMRSGEAEYEGSAFDLMVQEKFGIKFDLQTIDYSDYGEKFKVMFSTMNLPDISILNGVPVSELNEAGDRGVFLDYFQYMDIMPTLAGLITDHYDLMPYITAGSGAVYVSPLFYGMGNHLAGTGLGARTDILDAAGFDYSNLKDYDEVYSMFEALKAANPEQYVIGSRYKLGNIYRIGQAMGTTQTPARWNAANKEWEPTYDLAATKDFLTFWSNAYEDGILHPDFLTQASSDLWQMYYNGELTAFADSFAYLIHVENNEASPEYQFNAIMLPEHNGVKNGLESISGVNNGMMIVNAKTEYDQKIMKFIDWCYTDEAYLRVMYGETDIDIAIINQEPLQWISLNEAFKDNMPTEYHDKLLTAEEVAARKIESPYYLYGFYTHATEWAVFARNGSPNKQSPYEVAYKAYEEAGLYADAVPKVTLQGDELSEYNDLKTSVQDYADQIVSQIITGQLSVEDDWAKFLEDLDGLEYDRLVELYNIGSNNFYSVQPNYVP